MSQISIYLNPRASGASYDFSIDEVEKYFFRHKLKINGPQNLEELVEEVRADIKNKVEYIFSIGGDGTCHTIAQELIGSDTKLMVLAGGTANDFADEIGTKGAIKKLASIFHAQSTKKVDAIKVNSKYLISNGGIGIARDVAFKVNKYRKNSEHFHRFMKMSGKHAYQAVFAKELLAARFKQHHLFIDSPDLPLLEKKIKTPLILVNNQPKLAGSLTVAPHTKNDDGKFNVTIFLHDNRLDFLKAALVFFSGKYPEEDKRIISFETDKLDLLSLGNESLHFFGDGEMWDPSMELSISVNPKSLEVFTCEDIQYKGHSLEGIPLLT